MFCMFLDLYILVMFCMFLDLYILVSNNFFLQWSEFDGYFLTVSVCLVAGFGSSRR